MITIVLSIIIFVCGLLIGAEYTANKWRNNAHSLTCMKKSKEKYKVVQVENPTSWNKANVYKRRFLEY